MTKDKLSYKLAKIIKSVSAAIILPIFVIYMMVGKPDYAITNGLAHIVLPVANFAGSVITWPFRTIGNGIAWIHETYNIRSENEELKIRLAAALAEKNNCDITNYENQKLEHELDVKKSYPYSSVIADITFDSSAFYHNTFFINKGTRSGISKNMAVVSFDNRLVGVVVDCGSAFCKVRSLIDADTNIAVRIAGADVSGFLQGNGKNKASIGFFNDTQFVGRKGLKIITSNISGVLPSGIYVGDMLDENYVNVIKPTDLSRVMILKFNNQDSYKE